MSVNDSETLSTQLNQATPTEANWAEFHGRSLELRDFIGIVIPEHKPAREDRKNFHDGATR